jgi:hypothetical protein
MAAWWSGFELQFPLYTDLLCRAEENDLKGNTSFFFKGAGWFY